MQLETLFTEMADALRTKEETTSKISAESFPQRIKDLKVLDTTDATATADEIVAGKIAYANGKRVIGSIIDNGTLEYTPSDNEQEIPSGLTTGGVVKAADITTLNEYEACLTLANSIEVFDDYTDTTATPEDVVKGKTAYSNGEKITGVLEVPTGEYQAKLDPTLGGNGIIKTIVEVNNYDLTGISNGSRLLSNASNLKSAKLINTSELTTTSYMFAQCNKLEIVEIPDTSNVTDMSYMFQQVNKLISSPYFNTKKVSNMFMMFSNTNIVNVPVFDTSSATDMGYMFQNCGALSDESLNNILQMCVSAKVYGGTKTLKQIGLSQNQATTCTTLPNYQAFLDAGWTTGY